jgi:hypothetical protein
MEGKWMVVQGGHAALEIADHTAAALGLGLVGAGQVAGRLTFVAIPATARIIAVTGTISSTPVRRRWRFFTVCGSNVDESTADVSAMELGDPLRESNPPLIGY